MKWLTAIICLVLSMNVAAQEVEKPLPTVKEVTQKLDELYRSDSSHSMVTMEVVACEPWSSNNGLAAKTMR